MAFVLIIVGLLMIVTGGRGTYAQFGQQLASEFTGQGSFTDWFIAIVAAGALGYIPNLQLISRLLMTLIIISLFLSHKGFFQQFQSALSQGPTQPNAIPNSASSPSASNILSGQGTSGSTLGSVAQSLGAGTVNQYLQSLPGIGSWFAPSTAPAQ